MFLGNHLGCPLSKLFARYFCVVANIYRKILVYQDILNLMGMLVLTTQLQ